MRSELKKEQTIKPNYTLKLLVWQINPKEEILNIQWTSDKLAHTEIKPKFISVAMYIGP